jgi:hypothetical protein
VTAAAVSQIPHAAATIVPFDVRGRLEKLSQRNGQLTEQPGHLVKDHRRDRGAPAPAMPDRSPATQLTNIYSMMSPDPLQQVRQSRRKHRCDQKSQYNCYPACPAAKSSDVR